MWDSVDTGDATLSLAVNDGVAQQLPVLVRLWSALSLQGLLSFELPSLREGLAFSVLTGDVRIGKGVATTQNLSLSGRAVRLDVNGSVDLTQRTLDLKTALVPLHGITNSVSKVPLAGKLLARGTDRLTTVRFHVAGPYAAPTVTPLLVDTGEP